MRPWGQVDVKLALAVGGLLMTPASWMGATIWTKHNAAEDIRREQAEHARQLGELRTIPGKVERIETTVAALQDAQAAQAKAHSDAQREILSILRAGQK